VRCVQGRDRPCGGGGGRGAGLTSYPDRYPKSLSGGQRQRVARGFAIVRNPGLHERLGSTAIFVTRDQIEAMTMAARMVVMRAGRLERAGPQLSP
jgi:multiple sugar transport system ATP-binding protein